MSWDVFIQHLPEGVRRVADIPDEYEPDPLGARTALIEKIKRALPDADFSNPVWGKLDREDFKIEIGMTEAETVRRITVHVQQGSAAAVYAVSQIITAVGGRGLDSWTGELFDPRIGPHSLRRWRAYVDQS